MSTPYDKSYSTPREQIRLLRSRGMTIDDEQRAEHYLSHIGYYRLSAYMYPLLAFPKEKQRYKAGATFGQALRLYRFDKKLRLLLFNEIEKIEVAVRCAVVSVGCETTAAPFWMTQEGNFVHAGKFAKTVRMIGEEVARSKEEFIVRFTAAYSNPLPPAWIVAEILPFGVVTNIYANIKDKKIKKRVAQSFGLQPAPFESWLTIVALTRNACCHHARVWNKQNTIRPVVPNKTCRPWLSLPTDTLRVYFDICIIKYLLDAISPHNDMLAKLETLFAAFPEVDLSALGFPKGWEQEPLWVASCSDEGASKTRITVN